VNDECELEKTWSSAAQLYWSYEVCNLTGNQIKESCKPLTDKNASRFRGMGYGWGIGCSDKWSVDRAWSYVDVECGLEKTWSSAAGLFWSYDVCEGQTLNL